MGLSVEDISELLMKNTPEGVDLTLVGGQALEFWIELYSPDFPDVAKYHTIKTRDVDYTIRANNAYTKCYEHWSAVLDGLVDSIGLKKAGFSDATPEAAKISIKMTDYDSVADVENNFVIVDFLYDLKGIDKEDIAKNRILVDSRQLGLNYVLNEYMVLANRAHNVAKIEKKQSEHGLSQLKASIEVFKAYLTERLNENNDASLREAYKGANRIYKLAKWRVVGIPLYDAFNIDLMDAIPANVNWSKEFQDQCLPRWNKELSRLRKCE